MWGHEGDALEIGVWREEKLERWKRRFINMKLHIQWNITFSLFFPSIMAEVRSEVVQGFDSIESYCLNQKDETCPKVSKVVENHAFSE